ncbi:ribosomal RNA small subunit methyltransferase G [bacterium BMS3Abin14]|nr:ribosomal RNA small subunit methyltransferase G [bacterium BMS3Abin14]
MERGRFAEVLASGAALVPVDLDPAAVDLFYSYYMELVRWNRRINLVSRRQHDWIGTHFLDSLAPLGMGLISGHEKALDLGSGAGFPGLPLRIASPGLRIFLAEASTRKCAFLRHVVHLLELDAVKILEGRSEDFQEQATIKGEMDLVLTRAAARPKRILSWALPFLRPGGRILIYTGRDLVDNKVGNVHPYRGSDGHGDRVIWEVFAEDIQVVDL